MKNSHYEHKAKAYGMGHTRRARILELIGTTPKRVLDVGCGVGVFGAYLKQQGHRAVGIDISEEAVAEARTVLDGAWTTDIEMQWPTVDIGLVDVVVLGEVLEHVFNPVAVLQSAKSVLAPGGSVIITTPNFMTWTNRLRFLIGDFVYQDQGMFDFGHIRWFTYRYLREVLRDAKLRIVQERHIIFPGKLTSFLKRWPSLFAWQFIVKVQP